MWEHPTSRGAPIAIADSRVIGIVSIGLASPSVPNPSLALEVRAGSVGLLDIDSVAGFNPVARAMACAVFWRASGVLCQRGGGSLSRRFCAG